MLLSTSESSCESESVRMRQEHSEKPVSTMARSRKAYETTRTKGTGGMDC